MRYTVWLAFFGFAATLVACGQGDPPVAPRLISDSLLPTKRSQANLPAPLQAYPFNVALQDFSSNSHPRISVRPLNASGAEIPNLTPQTFDLSLANPDCLGTSFGGAICRLTVDIYVPSSALLLHYTDGPHEEKMQVALQPDAGSINVAVESMRRFGVTYSAAGIPPFTSGSWSSLTGGSLAIHTFIGQRGAREGPMLVQVQDALGYDILDDHDFSRISVDLGTDHTWDARFSNNRWTILPPERGGDRTLVLGVPCENFKCYGSFKVVDKLLSAPQPVAR